LSGDRGFHDQIRRASVSISSNIAEGFERDNKSAGEVRTQLYTAADIGYINQDQFKNPVAKAEEISRMIAKLLESLRKSKIQRLKHKQAK